MRRKGKGKKSINRIRLEFKAAFKTAVGDAIRVLIESDWNLKDYEGPGRKCWHKSINRIRLEFKGGNE